MPKTKLMGALLVATGLQNKFHKNFRLVPPPPPLLKSRLFYRKVWYSISINNGRAAHVLFIFNASHELASGMR